MNTYIFMASTYTYICKLEYYSSIIKFYYQPKKLGAVVCARWGYTIHMASSSTLQIASMHDTQGVYCLLLCFVVYTAHDDNALCDPCGGCTTT